MMKGKEMGKPKAVVPSRNIMAGLHFIYVACERNRDSNIDIKALSKQDEVQRRFAGRYMRLTEALAK